MRGRYALYGPISRKRLIKEEAGRFNWLRELIEKINLIRRLRRPAICGAHRVRSCRLALEGSSRCHREAHYGAPTAAAHLTKLLGVAWAVAYDAVNDGRVAAILSYMLRTSALCGTAYSHFAGCLADALALG